MEGRRKGIEDAPRHMWRCVAHAANENRDDPDDQLAPRLFLSTAAHHSGLFFGTLLSYKPLFRLSP